MRAPPSATPRSERAAPTFAKPVVRGIGVVLTLVTVVALLLPSTTMDVLRYGTPRFSWRLSGR